jgi:hypothetical protein
MRNLQNLSSNGSVNERTKRKKHKCDFKAHIATIKFHSNTIKLFGDGGFPSIVKLPNKKEEKTSMLEVFGDVMQENIEHVNDDSTPLPINFPCIRALMVATLMPIFVLKRKIL